MIENNKQSGFEDDEPIGRILCGDPEHNPPSHLYIPPGKRYRHVCPACGYTCYLRGEPPYTFGDLS